MRINTRSDTENFLVFPVEMRNNIRVLLELPSLLWSETNQNHNQKTVQNLEIAQETMEKPQLPKNCPNYVKWV